MSEARRPTLLHRIEHALFSAAVVLSAALGDRVSSAFGGALGRLGHFPLRFRRKLVAKHLRLAFPEKSDAWIASTMRKSYAHLGREALATIRLARLSRDQVIARTTVHGLAEFRRALEAGRGLVLASGHVGNHELGAAALSARGVPLDLVVQQQGNPLFDGAHNAARRRLGLGIIDRFQAHRLAIKALRGGRAVAFAADQNAGKAGVFVPFFGRLASTHRGAALFAVKTGAPLFLGTSLRRGAGYEVTLQPVDVDRGGDLDDVVQRLTAAFTARLEEVVRAAPDQYLWLHRRWKTPPPEERMTDKQV
ncbi:MAG: lysophospholipid acyltransferase family protein [Gemmatimonadota bacterium]